MELLFTPGINPDIHAVFLEQIAPSDPDALHVVIMDQAGFHLRPNESRLPAKVRVLSLPPYCPELNPAEWFGRVVKAATINRIYKGLRSDLPPLFGPGFMRDLVGCWGLFCCLA